MDDTGLPPTKRFKPDDGNDLSEDIKEKVFQEIQDDQEMKYQNFVTQEEVEKLKEFHILDEVQADDEKSDDEGSDDEKSDDGDGEVPQEDSDGDVPQEEIDRMLDENLPEEIRVPKPKEKPYITRQKIILEEKGINRFEVLPLDWIVVRHYSGMPVYMHRPSRVCTLAKPYFIGKENTRRHDIPISAVPCLNYRRALQEEEKQAEVDRRIAEQIRTGAWKNNQTDSSGVTKETDSSGVTKETDSSGVTKETDSLGVTKETDSLGVTKETDSLGVTKEADSSGVTINQPESLTEDQASRTGNTDTAKCDNVQDGITVVNGETNKKVLESESALKCPVNRQELETKTVVEESEVSNSCEVSENEGVKLNVTKSQGSEAIVPSDVNKILIDEVNLAETNVKKCPYSVDKCNIKNKSNDQEVTDAVEISNAPSIEPSNESEAVKNGPNSVENSNLVENNEEKCDNKNISNEAQNDGEPTDANASSNGPIDQSGADKSQPISVQNGSQSDDFFWLDRPNGLINGEQTAEEREKEIAELAKPLVLPGGVAVPPPRVESAADSWKSRPLSAADLHAYCKRLFKFKTISIMHFKRWADRRKYVMARKSLQYPSLPQGTKLITIPASQDNGSGGGPRRDWVMHMNGRSYLSLFHEYVRRALQKQPVYEFRQLENASSPYQATVYIGGMAYGVGAGSSKRLAKAAAARASIHVLIPGAARADDQMADDPDFSFFDYVSIEDPRIAELCAAACEPAPHAILRTCLLRNCGVGDRHIHTEMKKLEYQKVELTMRVGKHAATVVCKNKKTAKQRASQAILQALHPHITSWGSLLRLYGSRSVKSCKEKKQEEQEITLLQDKAKHNEPNYAVLEKLRSEMRKLRERDEALVPIGTLLVTDDLPKNSGSNLKNVEL